MSLSKGGQPPTVAFHTPKTLSQSSPKQNPLTTHPSQAIETSSNPCTDSKPSQSTEPRIVEWAIAL